MSLSVQFFLGGGVRVFNLLTGFRHAITRLLYCPTAKISASVFISIVCNLSYVSVLNHWGGNRNPQRTFIEEK